MTRPYSPLYAAQESFNRATHSGALREMQTDWSANGDSLRELEPAEHIQADPLTVIRSIERADIVWTAFIFVSAFVGIGAFFAMGAK